MSRNTDDGSDEGATPPTHLTEVKILRVEFFTAKYEWSVPILETCHPTIAPRSSLSVEAKKLTFEQAKRLFNGLAVSGVDRLTTNDVETEEDQMDVDAILTAGNTDDADLVYDQACEKRTGALRSLIGATAQCLVEYTPAPPRGAKRQKSAPRAKAYIIGNWPVLSDAVRFDVLAMPFISDVQPKLPGYHQTTLAPVICRYDALRSGCRIGFAERERATVGDFHSILLNTTMLHANAAGSLVRSLFAGAYGPTPGIVYETLTGPDGGAIDLATPLENTFAIDELRAAIEGERSISWLTIDTNKAFFQTITAFFHSAALQRISAAYSQGSRWFDILARGRAFVQHVDYLLCHAPHILCVKRLKFAECVRKQKELKALKSSAARRDTSRAKIAQFDNDCGAMRGLIMLPERKFSEYRQTLADNVAAGRQSVLAEADRPVVTMALDIYSLMLYDQSGNVELCSGKQHADRVKRSEHGSASGHMFTVIDGTPRALLTGYDSAGALGAVSLDDWVPAPTPAAVAPPKPTAGTSEDDDDWNDDENGGLLSLPRAVPAPPPATKTRAQAYIDFNDILSRLALPGTPDQFVAGMRWLIDQSVVTRVPMIGTGPRNRGKPFDAFYLSSVYSAQSKCVAVLRDIYERGVADAIERRAMINSPGYNLAAARQHHEQNVAALREQCSFVAAARTCSRVLGVKHSESLSHARNARDVASTGGPALGPPTVTPEALASMARVVCSHVNAFVSRRGLAETSISPAYADLAPAPVAGARSLTFGLLKDPTPPALDGEIELCPEQVRAIERSLVSPISIVTGRAGTGKTEVLRRIVAPYPHEQVLVTAFTGKVVSELTRRVHSARTMHSLLYSEMLHKQEAARVQSLLASLRARAALDGQQDTPLGEIVNLREMLFKQLGVAEHPSPFENIRVLVIDEASLMPFTMLESLLSAVHDCQKRSGRFLERLIICGDPWQLYPIGYGSVLSDLCRAFPHCVHHMTINHRSEGDAIFRLANDIAMQRLGTSACPMPAFGGPTNDIRLQTPTQCRLDGTESLEEQKRKLRECDDASVVFLPATPTNVSSVVRHALEMLGAIHPSGASQRPVTPDMQALRNSILMIASMRHIVSKLNDICRSLFFADTFTKLGGEMQLSGNGDLMLPPAFMQRIVPGDRIILKHNWRESHYIENDDLDDEDAEVDDDGFRVPSTSAEALEEAAVSCQLMLNMPRRRVTTSFFNGELLQAVCFYDAPAVVKKTTPCRCGLCPVAADGEQQSRGDCVLRPHEVPIGRRVPTDLNDFRAVKYHTQGMTMRSGEIVHHDTRMRRMAVFRLVNEPTRFKEVDVGRRLVSLRDFSYVQAATVHVIQGSEAPIVFFVAVSDSVHVDWSAVYTAVTRPRQRLVIVADPRALQNMVRRQPPLRRSDMWALLAYEVVDVHSKHRCTDDPWLVARALNIDDETTRALVDTRRTSETLTRDQLWAEYDRVKAVALRQSADDAIE